MHSKKNEVKDKLSRRSFIAALAAAPLVSIPFDPASAAAPTFSFVYLSDIHLVNGQPDNGFKMLQESQLFLQDTIKYINALKPDFVIFGGDQVETIGANEANWQLFIDLVQSLSAPWTFVLGEQDVSGKIPPDKMREFGPDFKGRGISGSTPYWSADPIPNVHLIGLDSSMSNSVTGDLQEQQLEWLKKDLAANKGKFTIVVSHHPLLPPAPYDGGPPWDDYIVPNGADVREIIGANPDVHLVLSGHLYMNKIQIERDVYHVSCAALNVYPCQYKYFKIGKDSIIMESHEVPFPALVKKARKALAESSFASRINRRNPEAVLQLCEGSPEDQHALLSLAAAKSVRELSKKQLKEDIDRRDEELDKQAEAARNKGKSKGKEQESKKKDGRKKEPEKGKAETPEKESKPSQATDSLPKEERQDTASGGKDAAQMQGKEDSKAGTGDAAPKEEKEDTKSGTGDTAPLKRKEDNKSGGNSASPTKIKEDTKNSAE